MSENSIVTTFRDKYNHTLKYKHVRYNKTLNEAQRLNARDLMWLIAFVEGDGFFGVTKSNKIFKI
jgi:hypothetical protein